MRRVAFLIMVFAFSALAWPAAVAHAHTPIHAWVNADDCEVIVRLGSHLEEDHMHFNSPGHSIGFCTGWYLSLLPDKKYL